MEFAPSFAPIMRLDNALARDAVENPFTDQRVVTADDNAIWRWDGATWVPDEETPLITYAPALSAGIIKADFIDVAVIDTVLLAADEASIVRINAEVVYITGELDAINATIYNLDARTATIETAYITTAQVETLIATYAYITEAEVETLLVTKAYITEAEVETLVATYGYITELQVENLLVSGAATFVGTVYATDGEFSGTITAGAVIAADTLSAPTVSFFGMQGHYLTVVHPYGGSQYTAIDSNSVLTTNLLTTNLQGVSIAGLSVFTSGGIKYLVVP
jgi:hypothetical protein